MLTSLTALLGLEEEQPQAKQGVFDVMRELSHNCAMCPLGLHAPQNRGLLWKGNPNASVAVIGDTPSPADMSAGKAFVDEAGKELEQWLSLAGVPEAFYTYVVQCKTPPVVRTKKVVTEDESVRQRAPQLSGEVSVCMPNRLFRVLRAMPNLEVAICLGLDTQKALLGGDPQMKSHVGQWFGCDNLPGIAFFGLPHPRDYDAEVSELKRGRIRQCLTYFKTDYYGRQGKNGKFVVEPKKIIGIMRFREAERREAKQRGAA